MIIVKVNFLQEPSTRKKSKSKPPKNFLTPVRNGDKSKIKPSNFTTPVNKTSPSSLTEKITSSVNRAQVTLKKFSAEVNVKRGKKKHFFYAHDFT